MDADALIKPTKCGAKGDVVGLSQVSIPSPVKEETVDEAKASGLEDSAPFRGLPSAVGRALVKMVEGLIWESAAIDEHLRYVVEMHWPQRARTRGL